jgi:hypothetical protein
VSHTPVKQTFYLTKICPSSVKYNGRPQALLIRCVPESKVYYEKKRAEGKSHNQAVRALGRHLVRVIWSMLKNGRDYELREVIPSVT